MTIHVRNWEKFQHADVTKRGRAPAWIKVYTELLSDENYLALTPTRRCMLIGIWIEYARTRRELPDDTASLSRRLAQRVQTADLQALEDAGFVTLSNGRAHADATLTTRARRREKKPSTKPEPLNQEAQDEKRHAAVTPLSSLEERREEQTVRRTGSVDVAAPLDVEELEAWEPPADNVVPLDSRRPQGEVNGKPIGDVVKPLLDGLLARAQSP